MCIRSVGRLLEAGDTVFLLRSAWICLQRACERGKTTHTRFILRERLETRVEAVSYDHRLQDLFLQHGESQFPVRPSRVLVSRSILRQVPSPSQRPFLVALWICLFEVVVGKAERGLQSPVVNIILVMGVWSCLGRGSESRRVVVQSWTVQAT